MGIDLPEAQKKVLNLEQQLTTEYHLMNQIQISERDAGYHGANLAQVKTDTEDAVENVSVTYAADREAFQKLSTTNTKLHTNPINSQDESA